ncbi:VID27 cytoplasmic protein-domain-containing protein [Haematococcus lacustris]
MGQNASTEGAHDAVNDVEGDLAQKPERGIKLFRFVRAGNTGSWELASSNASPRFYDSNEDSTTSGKADWFLEVGDIEARVDSELSYVMDLPGRRITFSAGEHCYALRFPNSEMFRSFAEELNDKAFYNLTGLHNDESNRTKEMGADYAGIFFAKDISERMSEPMEVPGSTPDVPSPQGETRDEQAMETNEDDDGSTYQGLIMGAGENNFLMRGRHFDVLRNVVGGVEDKGVTFTIGQLPGTPGPRTPGMHPYATPPKVLLAQSERKMNLLTPDNPNKLMHADIETGKVVSTWSFKKDGVEINMKDIVHDDKAGQLDDRSTFLGLDNNRLCKWDLRDPNGVVNTTPVVQYCPGGKDYSRGTNFQCMATSGDGFVAVGSKDGKVRLYDGKKMTQAKTAIPGLGAPITAIDVTHDGKWVLATTDKYLMVVKTTYEDDKGRDANGFTSRMGGRGAVPRLLRLRPEDTIRTDGRPLSKGKFTWITEKGMSERWVAASCGNFSVVWNFTKVKNCGAESLSFGGLPTSMDYIINSKDEDVVDSAFLHPKYAKNVALEQAALVVATPHRLFNMN